MKTILFVCLFFIATAALSGQIIDKAIVVLNSEPILQSELKSLVERSKKEGGIDEMLLMGDSVAKLRAEKKLQIDFLIREKLIELEIKRLGLGYSADKVNTEINQMAARNQMSREQLESTISRQGYSLTEYKKVLKARLERQAFFESEIIGKLRITDEDAYSEYRRTSSNFRENVSSFKLSQIFFNPRKGSADEAQKRAEEIARRISAGEVFETLANKYNEDPSGDDGGLLGEFKTGEFIPELEKAIEPLSAGESTQPIRTKKGFHIVKVLEKKSTQDPNFIRVKEQIKAKLVEKNFGRQLKNWIESKKQDANIEIY